MTSDYEPTRLGRLAAFPHRHHHPHLAAGDHVTILAVALGLICLVLAKLVMHQAHIITGLERMSEHQRSQLRHPSRREVTEP